MRHLAPLLALALSAAAPPVAAQTITTVAGNGEQGAGPDGALARESPLFMLPGTPAGVVFDRDGNLYFSEAGANRVRRLEKKSGRLFTVAGTGVAGNTGDGGPALAAKLNEPGDLAFDPAGNLYVSDLGNNRVRKIDLKTGTIDAFAGNGRLGFAQEGVNIREANLGRPLGIAFDAEGNFYVMDPYSSRLLAADVRTKLFRTIVGNGSMAVDLRARKGTEMGLDIPTAVRVTSKGDVVFSVSDSHAILKVNPKTDDLTLVAGTLLYGWTGDGGPATKAHLWNPTAIALDRDDDVWVIDSAPSLIRRIDAKTGIIETRVGSATVTTSGEVDMGGFSGDGGPAAKARLNRPAGLGFDRDGNLYVLDTLNNRIRKVEKAAR